MKAGWEIKKLGDLCKFIDYRGKTPQKTEGGLKLITAKNVKMGFLQEEPLEYVNQDIYDKWMTRGIPQYGDIIFTTEAPLGNIAQLHISDKVVFAQRIIILHPIRSFIDSTFLKYHLLAPVTQEDIQSKGTGATVKGIKASLLKTIEVSFPPLPEQRRIVAILYEAFADIAAAKEKAEQNLKNAKEVFASCLESVFSQRGEGWNEMTLKEISSSFGMGKSKHRPRNYQKLYGGKYPFIQTGDIRNANHIITDYSQTYNENGLTQSKLWPKGTICITIAANIAETAILNFDACFPDSVI